MVSIRFPWYTLLKVKSYLIIMSWCYANLDHYYTEQELKDILAIKIDKMLEGKAIIKVEDGKEKA